MLVTAPVLSRLRATRPVRTSHTLQGGGAAHRTSAATRQPPVPAALLLQTNKMASLLCSPSPLPLPLLTPHWACRCTRPAAAGCRRSSACCGCCRAPAQTLRGTGDQSRYICRGQLINKSATSARVLVRSSSGRRPSPAWIAPQLRRPARARVGAASGRCRSKMRSSFSAPPVHICQVASPRANDTVRTMCLCCRGVAGAGGGGVTWGQAAAGRLGRSAAACSSSPQQQPQPGTPPTHPCPHLELVQLVPGGGVPHACREVGRRGGRHDRGVVEGTRPHGALVPLERADPVARHAVAQHGLPILAGRRQEHAVGRDRAAAWGRGRLERGRRRDPQRHAAGRARQRSAAAFSRALHSAPVLQLHDRPRVPMADQRGLDEARLGRHSALQGGGRRAATVCKAAATAAGAGACVRHVRGHVRDREVDGSARGRRTCSGWGASDSEGRAELPKAWSCCLESAGTRRLPQMAESGRERGDDGHRHSFSRL